MRVLEAAIFDLDGVITDTSSMHFKAWEELAKEIGIKLPKEFNEKLKGISRMKSLDLILQFGKCKCSDLEISMLADKKNNYYLNYVKAITDANLLPGVLECFNLLKEKDIKIVLASASSNANLVMKLLNIENYFDFIVNPKEIKEGKPDSEIFIRAAEGIGIKPCNCIGIEDSVAGIIAINSCGMFSIGIGKKEVLYMANICIKDLKEFNLEEIQAMGGFI
ncbi:MAG: beta-phosphoglucomutase [Actinobacteria bacterium]|nr:beta-phosphoglucomutase [Cyanobacteriota bacterium]MCL5771034.1 beta-phosphoglucomutase [Actinomycetota bacterium]